MSAAIEHPRSSVDPIDAKLLDRLQVGVPLVRHPFAEIAAELGLSQQDVLERMQRLRRKSS